MADILLPGSGGGGGGSGSSFPNTYKSGRWYSGVPAFGAPSTGLFAGGADKAIFLLPWVQRVSQTFDQVGLWVTTGATGTAVVLRYGLYKWPVGAETTLTLQDDWGTVPCMTSGAEATISINKDLDPGLYSVVAVLQGTTISNAPTIFQHTSTGIAALAVPYMGFHALNLGGLGGISYRTPGGTVIAGALPATINFNTLIVSSSGFPDVRLRAA